MLKKSVGQKGQVVIPKYMRDALGIKAGADVTIEVRGQEIVRGKPKIEGSYTDYYVSTVSPKLREPIDIDKMIENQTY
jgi:AbrB family looped-hinge helix DNA binding protein